MELSKNSRAHWSEKHETFQEHKRIARAEINRQLRSGHTPHTGPVQVIATWYAHRRPMPDRDNAITRLSPYSDAAEETGLIQNDVQIESYRVIYSLDRHNPRVELTFVLGESA